MFTKRLLWQWTAWCLVVLLGAAPAAAEGWSTPKWPSSSSSTSSSKKPSTVSQTLKRLDAGAKKFVRGTVDVITLKPLRTKPLPPPSKPWLNNTTISKKGQAKKNSSWNSWFGSKKTDRPRSMQDFAGLDRPG